MYFLEALSNSEMLFREDDVIAFDATNKSFARGQAALDLGITSSLRVSGDPEQPGMNMKGTFLRNDSNSLNEYLTDMLGERRQKLSKVIPITAIYSFIFVIGVIGNITTCVVIATKR